MVSEMMVNLKYIQDVLGKTFCRQLTLGCSVFSKKMSTFLHTERFWQDTPTLLPCLSMICKRTVWGTWKLRTWDLLFSNNCCNFIYTAQCEVTESASSLEDIHRPFLDCAAVTQWWTMSTGHPMNIYRIEYAYSIGYPVESNAHGHWVAPLRLTTEWEMKTKWYWYERSLATLAPRWSRDAASFCWLVPNLSNVLAFVV